MGYSNRLPSALVLMGALAIGAAPVWAQTGSGSSGSGGSATGQGSSDGGYSVQSGGSKSQSGSSADQGPGSSRSGSGMSSSSDTSSSDMSTSPSSRAAGSEEVKRVQQALKDQGQDPGPIDGIIGPKTKQALRAFQQQQGLSATGTLDSQTKEKLGLSDSGSSSSLGKSSSSKSSGSSSDTGSSRSSSGSNQ